MSEEWMILAVFLGIIAALYFIIAKTIAGELHFGTCLLMRCPRQSEQAPL